MAIKAATPARKRLIRAKKRGPKKSVGQKLRGSIAIRRAGLSIRGKAKIAMIKARRTNLWRRKRKKRAG